MPKSILKGKGPDLQSTSTVMDSLKTKSVTFKDFVVSGKDVIVSGVKVTKDNVIDVIDRVKQADISGFLDTSTSTKVAEAKTAAVKSVDAGPSNFPSPATTPNIVDNTPTSVADPSITSISEPRTGFTPGMDSTPTKPSTNSILGLVTPENTPMKGVDLSELSPTKSEKGLT